uniref:Uncharacterized protein n=1 Tax=Arundo donax TaxID=35708 RepID=A0A0A9DWV1_ARUDO
MCLSDLRYFHTSAGGRDTRAKEFSNDSATRLVSPCSDPSSGSSSSPQCPIYMSSSDNGRILLSPAFMSIVNLGQLLIVRFLSPSICSNGKHADSRCIQSLMHRSRRAPMSCFCTKMLPSDKFKPEQSVTKLWGNWEDLVSTLALHSLPILGNFVSPTSLISKCTKLGGRIGNSCSSWHPWTIRISRFGGRKDSMQPLLLDTCDD